MIDWRWIRYESSSATRGRRLWHEQHVLTPSGRGKAFHDIEQSSVRYEHVVLLFSTVQENYNAGLVVVPTADNR